MGGGNSNQVLQEVLQNCYKCYMAMFGQRLVVGQYAAVADPRPKGSSADCNYFVTSVPINALYDMKRHIVEICRLKEVPGFRFVSYACCAYCFSIHTFFGERVSPPVTIQPTRLKDRLCRQSHHYRFSS